MSGSGQEHLTHPHTHANCFSQRDCTTRTVMWNQRRREWRCALFPPECVFSPKSLCALHQLCQDRIYPSKASTDLAVIENRPGQIPPPAGICWVHANASHSKEWSEKSRRRRNQMEQKPFFFPGGYTRRMWTCTAWLYLCQHPYSRHACNSLLSALQPFDLPCEGSEWGLSQHNMNIQLLTVLFQMWECR